ncbi:MAG: epimerase [Crocinitomicaceae bacterium]|nr:epimerase [Crocinitomicaceae bacterium]|tara:strand:+ start:1817 stop:2740 length:924 start_codon:yes stop_codon:yes gene_type:complete
MVKILITGGAGFIPGSLAAKLAENPNNLVVLVDNFVTGKKRNIAKGDNVRFIKCDVNNYLDIAPVMTSHGFDYVFHYAALVGVKRTLANPSMVLEDLQGIKNVLTLAKNSGVKRIFYSSSSEVYGEPVHLPQHEETTPLNSRLPYAIVKNAGEAFCKAFKQEFGLDYTIFRFFNTYGPLQSTDFVMSKFVRAAQRNDKITIYGDGEQTRTFCFIDDNLEATIKCMEENQYVNDIINVGNDSQITILDLAKLIIKTTGSKSVIEHLPPLPEGDMTRRQPDIGKMRKLLNRELLPLEQGLKILVEKGLF